MNQPRFKSVAGAESSGVQEVNIGDVVHSKFYSDNRPLCGVVTAVETYTTTAGTSHYVYVRWIDRDGKPNENTQRYETWELTGDKP